MKTEIATNPELHDEFFCTPNGERSPEEIEAWWGVPFIETESEGAYFVRCLDGGAWDRPSLRACCESLEEAVKVAEGLRASGGGFCGRRIGDECASVARGNIDRR